MVQLTFIEPGGVERAVETPPGSSLMEIAVEHSIKGILADCGGGCSCGTCHCYTDLEVVGEPSKIEDVMLDLVIDRQTGSRLSCQITVSEEMDGLVIRLPETQL